MAIASSPELRDRAGLRALTQNVATTKRAIKSHRERCAYTTPHEWLVAFFYRLGRSWEMAKMTFETAVERLEKIIRELGDRSQPLDIAMMKFEEAVDISKYCMQVLDETNKTYVSLVENERRRRIYITIQQLHEEITTLKKSS
ncbi:MAG: exodeoxyribonuclease VII small subunit [Desulfobacteraceae bacterium]|nr:exodeoxyribonuclease VII small subunit [Desulfobacteraceae bacterium]